MSADASNTRLSIESETTNLVVETPAGEVFTAGAQWSGLSSTGGDIAGAVLTPGCWSSVADVTVEQAEYAADGSVDTLTIVGLARCVDSQQVAIHFVAHVSSTETAGPIVGPGSLELGRVLEGDRSASVFVYNSSALQVAVDVDAPPVAGAVVAPGCPDTLAPGSGCMVNVLAERGASVGDLQGEIILDAAGTRTSIPYTAVHETAAYLRYAPFGFATILDVYDETTPGRRMVVSPTETGISFASHEGDSTWDVGVININGAEFPAAGTYELVDFDPEPGQLAVSGNIVCFDRGGAVVVHESGISDGQIDRFSASLTVTCGNDPAQTQYFSFRYNVPLAEPWLGISTRSLQLDRVDRYEPSIYSVEVTNRGRGPGRVEGAVAGSPFVTLGQGCVGTVLDPGESCDQEIVVSTDLPLRTGHDVAVIFDIENNALGPVSATGSVFFDTPDLTQTGYWVLQQDGTVTPFGDAPILRPGDLSARTYIHIEPTWDGRGYWLLDSNGIVITQGNATSYGHVTTPLEPGERVSTMASTPDSRGYWIFTNRGRVLPFGNAPDIGDLLGFDLDGEIIASTSSPSGRGAYMIGSDGGVFALGDARFAGSVPQVLPGVALDQPVVGLVADPDGSGYWMVAADGGVFAFEAPYRGSVPAVLPAGTILAAPVNGMVPFSDGYLLVAADGGVFNFSSEQFQGSLGDQELDSPVVAIAPMI
ncbi:MAG: hypothetical protein KDB16_07095 [Acidimicrobiales bacterium]|nr:hypothetical protein [Acidimicrobiales bacterium]